MARFFLSHTQVEGDTVTVTGADAHHIAHVLRMRAGENLTVCDMQKNEYLCCIAEIRENCVICVIQQKKKERHGAAVPRTYLSVAAERR